MVDRHLLNALETVKVPEVMVNSQKLVDYLKVHVAADTHERTVEAGVRRINEMLGLLMASELDVINALADVDQQLRSIGRRLNALEGRA